MSISIRNWMKKPHPEGLKRETVPRGLQLQVYRRKKNERVYRKTSCMAGGPVL